MQAFYHFSRLQSISLRDFRNVFFATPPPSCTIATIESVLEGVDRCQEAVAALVAAVAVALQVAFKGLGAVQLEIRTCQVKKDDIGSYPCEKS